MDNDLKYKMEKMGNKLREMQELYSELESTIKMNNESIKKPPRYVEYNDDDDDDVHDDMNSKNNVSETESDTDSYNTDDYYDGDEDNDIFNEEIFKNIPLSKNLLDSLNITQNNFNHDNNESQWTPPSHPGLNNSNKLI